MSPRTEEENQRIRDEQREKILHAAVEVFARKGLAAAKMADIATAANVSYGLAYHYFANKDRLFAVLVEGVVQGTIDLYQQALKRAGTPWDKLSWLVSRVLEGLEKLPAYSMILLQVYTNEAVPEDLRELVRKERLLTRQVLRQLIVEGQVARQVAPGDPEQLLTTFMACIQGLAFDALFLEQEGGTRSIPDAQYVLRIIKV